MKLVNASAVLLFLACCSHRPGGEAASPSSLTQGSERASPPSSESATSRVSTEFELMICVDNVALLGKVSPGLRYVTEFLTSRLDGMNARPSKVVTGLCKTAPIKITGCHGSPGRLACRVDDIANLLAQGHFWMRLAEEFPTETRDRRASLGTSAPSDAVASLVRSSVIEGGGTLPTLPWLASDLGVSSDALGALLVDTETWIREGGDKNAKAGAAWLATTFLLGHELFHVHSEQCGTNVLASTEKSGFWDYAVSAMSNEELFCVTPQSPEELRADRCGLRWLRAAHGLASEDDAHNAAEMLGWNIATGGLESRVNEQSDAAMIPMEGYLNPALRIALVNEELGTLARENKPTQLCDRLARSAIMAIQKDVRSCPNSRGNLDDALLARLPVGVSPAFEGGPWKDPESFACPQ